MSKLKRSFYSLLVQSAAAAGGKPNGPPKVYLAAACRNDTYYVMCLMDTTAPVTFCLPKTPDTVFAVKLEDKNHEAAYKACTAMLGDLGLKGEKLESFMAGEINVMPYTLEPLPIGDGEAIPGALHLRVVVTPFPGGAARAPERGTRWPTLHDISDEAYYVMASAAWTRCIGMGAPTQAHRFLRIGRGTTMAVTTDMAQGAKPAKFDTLLTWAEEGRLALKKGLHDMADEKGCDEARQNFYRGLADRCDPLPLKEIPVALQLATTAFDDNDLATCPYKYKSVIPITDPLPAPPPAVTSWPEEAAFPSCSLDCLTPECHKACDDWLTRNDTWHTSGGKGKRPEALCFGFDVLRTEVKSWFEAGGVINFCTEPPSILVEAGQCYVAPVNGARAADMFATRPTST